MFAEFEKAQTRQADDELIEMKHPAVGDPARTLALGVTGAGKSALLRHLTGASVEGALFLPQSATRTTTAPTDLHAYQTEIYRITAVLRREDEVENLIGDMIEAATRLALEQTIGGYASTNFKSSLIRTVTKHPDEDFGLEPLLGKRRKIGTTNEDSFWDSLADDVAAFAARFTLEPGSGNRDSAEKSIDQICDKLDENPEFQRIQTDLMDAIRSKLSEFLSSSGGVTEPTEGWPRLWQFESKNRQELHSRVVRLNGHDHHQFGSLLTPRNANQNVRPLLARLV